MKKNRRKGNAARDKPQSPAVAFFTAPDGFESLCVSGYTRLSDNPEVLMAVGRIAELIGTMTIHLMRNTENGDVRVRNALSRKIDISPNRNMTRKTFLTAIVRTLLLEGAGNSVVYPEVVDGRIEELVPLKPSLVRFLEDGRDYLVWYGGQAFRPDQVMHFVLNPDPEQPWRGQGYRVALKDVVHNLKQAAATKKGFMESKWKPSLVVRVDTGSGELADRTGRRAILRDYIDTDGAGEPWVIPADEMEIQQVKPLTLNDLALNDAVTLDKRTVAGIFNVPPFVVGAGTYDKDEWNNFINATIMPIARSIEQEFTRKLLISPDLYFRFNVRSLFNYSLDEIVNAGKEMVDRMAMRRNEWRDWIGLSPDDDMNELLALENYIPAERLGDQRKLLPKTGEGEAPVEKVAEVSLNGAQIQSMLSIVQSVAAKQLQYGSAVTLITSAFPFDEATAKAILGEPSKLEAPGGET